MSIKSNNQTTDDIIDKKTLLNIDDETAIAQEGMITLSEIEPQFFSDEKIIERIVNGTLNTIPMSDLMR